MGLTAGNIEFYAGPKQIGAPDDLEKVIVDFIDGAKTKLDVAVQELESKAITEALVRARERKVTVSIVLEADYLSVAKAIQNPFQPGGTNEENRFLHNAILRANIKVRTDYNASIFHQKFIIRDSEQLLTGSTNFTPTGVGRNLNHVIIIRDKAIAKTYQREFREISQGHFGKLNEGHDPAPPELKISQVPVKILFAPDHNPEMEIMKQIAKARKRVDFAIFTFAESSGIDDQLVFAHNANIKIRGVMDAKQANQDWAARHSLRDKGVTDLHIIKKTSKANKLHHKLMVIDGQVVIGGSFNYTGPANRLNDENIIILGDLEEPDPASVAVQKKLAQFALDEIGRIIAEEAEPCP